MKSIALYNPRKQMHRQTIREIIASGVNLLNTYTPHSAEVEKMGFYRAPLAHCRPWTPAAMAFRKLWNEVDTRLLQGDPHEY